MNIQTVFLLITRLFFVVTFLCVGIICAMTFLAIVLHFDYLCAKDTKYTKVFGLKARNFPPRIETLNHP